MKTYNRRTFLGMSAGLALTGYEESNTIEQAVEGCSSCRVNEAVVFFGERNCCQSVLATYASELGMDKTLALRIAQGMPGIGGLGNVCGTVSGATMVIGLKLMNEQNLNDKKAKQKTRKTVQEFVARFKGRHQSIKCRDLLGYDNSTPEKAKIARENNAFDNCRNYVRSSVEILEELFA